MNLTIALQEIWAKQPHLILIAGFIILVGFVSKMKLFAKADQPIEAAFVPGWDLIIIMRIIGRPDKHAWYFAILRVQSVGSIGTIIREALKY
jgi:hypothetical protein